VTFAHRACKQICRSGHVHTLDKEGSFPPRKRASATRCGVSTLLVIEQRHDRRDVGDGFWRKRLACCEVLFIPRRTRMVGRKEARRAEAVVHLSEVGSTRENMLS